MNGGGAYGQQQAAPMNGGGGGGAYGQQPMQQQQQAAPMQAAPTPAPKKKLNWVPIVDDETGETYYYNEVTGASEVVFVFRVSFDDKKHHVSQQVRACNK